MRSRPARRARTAAAIAALPLLLALPGPRAAAGAEGAVATIAPIADLVREVGGPAVSVTTLLPPGASPHTYEPTPAAARALAAARAVFLVGAGLDAWAARLVAAAAPPGAVVVDLSAGVELVDGGNPHYWLDPRVAAALVDRIEAALARALPAERAGLAARAAALRGRLGALDAELADAIAALPTRRLVTFHGSWPYLARRYGLEVVGVIETAPGREPGPRHLAGIVARIRALGVPAVFAEPQLSPRAAEEIAREAGVRVLVLDPLGGVPGREGYEELMRFNLRSLEEGLGAP